VFVYHVVHRNTGQWNVPCAGAELDGATYIKYVRAIKTADKIHDTCISDDQMFRVIYAMGQEATNFSHVPGSFLETIGSGKAYNEEFYKTDELKFHGGGIGSGSPRRGSLGSQQVNLFMDDASTSRGGGCVPSTLAPEYDCMVSRLGGNAIIHYKSFVDGDTGAKMAAETPSTTGWLALGFHPPGSPMMPGSTAVIATSSAASRGVGVFDINDRSASAIVEATGATTGPATRRLAQASSNVPFTITDVRPLHPLISNHSKSCSLEHTRGHYRFSVTDHTEKGQFLCFFSITVRIAFNANR
jgi:hypothetical protein